MNFPNWKLEIIKKFREGNLKNEKISFIHIPKCAGTYASQYISLFNINMKNHNRAEKPEDGLTFGIIRHPVERFQSFLNYRLGEETPRKDFPERLHYVYSNKNISLNTIVDSLTDEEILSFRPYRSINYWAKNIDLLLTIDEFIPALALMGFNTTVEFPQLNVSQKIRGNLTGDRIDRINNLFKKDIRIYNKWTLKN